MAVTANEVAEWMLEQLKSAGILHQKEAVDYIIRHYGESFIYVNENGNQAISKEVKKYSRNFMAVKRLGSGMDFSGDGIKLDTSA